MKWRFPLFGPLAILALCLFAMPIHAQTAAATNKTNLRPWYDVTKEVTLTGTVSSVVEKSTRESGMLMGSHLMVQTASGKVDASLGKFAMKGEGALSVTAGQSVQMIGVMKTIKDKQVFVTRIVQVNGHAFTIRNEHGFVLARGSSKGSASFGNKGGRL
jgi:hypothetical protein